LNPLRTFGFLLKDTNRLYTQRFEQRAAALGLTLPQCRVLIYLANNEGISQAQLAELTDLEPMTLVRSLDFLESQDWLERRNDPTDRRARRLYLKAPGRPRVADIWNLVHLTQREAFAGIPKKQADIMIEVLEKVRSNISSLEPLARPSVEEPLSAGRIKPSGTRARRERTVSPS
jgi:DNA-binding MarR family transcriptional regulator